MTAINVLLLADRVHVFADGGHHRDKTLVRIGPKTYPLPSVNAVLAWSGPSDDVHAVLDAIKLTGVLTLPDLIRVLPGIVGSFGWSHPFSAILVGVWQGVAMGVTVEEGGRVKTLAPGNMVRALSSTIGFDLTDIVSSGLRMMEDQRHVHGIVAGYVQHVLIKQGKIDANVIRRWPDLVSGGAALTHAVKIQDLSVDTINFANSAVTGVASTSTSITIPNEDDMVLALWGTVTVTYNGTFFPGVANITLYLRRTRGTKDIAITGDVCPGTPGTVSSVTRTTSTYQMDNDSIDDDEYSIIVTQSHAAPAITINTKLMYVVYRKR